MAQGITQDEVKRFLNKYHTKKGNDYTHTSIGNPKTSLYVSDEEYNEFMEQYRKLIVKGVSLHLTEKPKDPSAFRVDMDFRFILTTPKSNPLPRIYKNYNIERIVTRYIQLLCEYLPLTQEHTYAYVMEKSNPTEYKGKLKDGIHIIFPEVLVCHKFQHFIRHRILSEANTLFEGLPLTNPFENIIDEAIIDRNNWQMYGSCKPECETYIVTKIYQYNINESQLLEVELPCANKQLDWVERLSMRKQGVSMSYRNEKKDEIEEFIRVILPSKINRRKDSLHQQIFGNAINLIKTTICDEELDIARRLVKCLNKARAENYEDWIKVGWTLRNIDYRLLENWVMFSQVSNKYVSGECEKLWDHMRIDTLSMGTLRYWAKKDNPTEYEKIDEDNVLVLIDRAAGTKGADYDVANVVYTMYKHQYRYTVKDVWYVFREDKHRWECSKDGLQLRKIIYQLICQKFMNRSTHWNQQSILHPDDEERCQTKSKSCLEIAMKLKKAGFNDSIIKVCKVLFTDPKFEELLDSRPHLIGFENGVYDLRLHEFREGLPDDYISFCSTRHYIAYNPQSTETKEIETFMSQVFTNSVIRKFVWDVFASILDGGIRHEKFYIFTGCGSNSKSKLLELVQKAVGDYYCILPISLLTQKRAASNSAQSELERTKGRRFAVMQEPSEGEKLNIGLMKELSGGDTILCRGLFKEPIQFKPQFKMIMTCNELPEVPSDDGGTWRRIRVIHFDSKFIETPDPNNSKEFPIDTELGDNFDRWADTFLSMMIQHHKQNDLKNIIEPMEVRIATESYKKNNDIIGQYISERIVQDEETDDVVMLQAAYTDFKIWVTQNVPKGKRIPDRMQLRAYMERFYGAYPTDGKGWRGLRYVSNHQQQNVE
uniref:SF3 helicase domain-containing protein n=1 Tax=viral metagenome TaxID=1070528 RepID=A0A6C0CS02_9ZZZZ